jgi:lipoprotein NlpI
MPGENMRFSMPLAALAIVFAVSGPARADTQSDLDQCKFAGVVVKNADPSIAACDRLLKDPKITGTSRAAAFSNRCGWWWAKKDPEHALSDCNEAIKVDPNYAAAYINRGNAYLNKSDFDHAFTDFNEAIRLDPKNAWAYAERGNLYTTKGDFDHALADFTDSIKFDPSYAMAHFFRGQLYKTRGDFDRALADLNDSIRLDPNYAMAYFTHGTISFLKGDNAAALADFKNAIELDPKDETNYFSRGVAYLYLGGHVADAEADFRKASQLNPKDAYAALWLDIAARRNNHVSRLAADAKELDMTAWPAPIVRQFLGELTAAQTLSAAADSDPKTQQGQTCEANFYGGQLALLKKEKAGALRMLKLASTDCPRSFIESTAALAELLVKR